MRIDISCSTLPERTTAPWPDITLVGCGNMGGALRRGWLNHGLPADHLTIVERESDHHPEAAKPDFDQRMSPTLPRVVVIAIKPDQFASSADTLRPLGQGVLLLSVMAGVPLARLRACFPDAAGIVRAMPNMAAAVGESATTLCAEAGLSAPLHHLAQQLLLPVGSLHWLTEEASLAPATALAGSGPAFFYYFVEMLTQAAVALGLPESVARALANQTFIGSAHLLDATGRPPAELRRAVTSPGGTTQAGLEIWRETLGSLSHAALAAACARAKAMADQVPG
jgi:pyrroline-5-carboxylate reductase